MLPISCTPANNTHDGQALPPSVFATGQNLANLIPALQLNASKVVILETPEMRDSASNLKRALLGVIS